MGNPNAGADVSTPSGRERFHVGDGGSGMTSPIANPAVCDSTRQRHTISVPMGSQLVDGHAPHQVRFTHMMDVGAQRDVRVQIRYVRFQRTIAMLAHSSFGTSLIFTAGDSLSLGAPRVANSDAGDRFVVHGADVSLTNR